MTINLRPILFGLVSLTLAACGGGGGAGSSDGTDAPEPATAALSHVADCDALLTAVRADAHRKIGVQADELRAEGWRYLGSGLPRPISSATPAWAPTPAPQASPAAPDATDTNTQVPGVDEADVVETDGTRIYLLQGEKLLVLNALPPAESTLVEQVPIEGWPLGMFVAGGRALVVSSVSDSGELGGDSLCGQIGAPFPRSERIDNPWFDFLPSSPSSCAPPFVKVTLLDVTATPARTVRELYVEGSYVAARRHGSRARVIVERTWGTPADLTDPWQDIGTGGAPATEAELLARVDGWERRALATIDTSTLADWLPAARERVNGALVDRPLACDQAAVPPAGHVATGSTLVVGFDITTDDGPIADTLLLGSAAQIYANADTLVLAQWEWQAEPFDDAETRTALHAFTLAADALTPVYRGSGYVPGMLSSQFGLDVDGDVVRAATTFARTTDLGWRTVTRVTTARITDDGLVPLGASADLAPGESLRAVRFVGARAYLVTFLQIDPLFVVDLSDPTNVRTLGELELPGFSEYLHPLDPDHFLTIGRAGTAQGQTLGVALRLFDVSDPTAPRQTADYVLPIDASTPAEYDHLAFTLDASRGLLALPVTSYDGASGNPRANLQLFDIDLIAGIDLRGVITHGDPGFVPCSYDPSERCPAYETMRRALLIAGTVYSISNVQMHVHALDDLTTPLATVALP